MMSIYELLFKWQKGVIDEFAARRSFGLWTDMGTGKTPMSLALAEANDCDRIIVVTLNAKVYESETLEGSWRYWARHYKTWLTFYDKGSKEIEDAPSMLVINYESLFERGKRKTAKTTLKQVLVEYAEKCHGHRVALIIDESHKVKNLQSQQYRAVEKLQQMLFLRASIVKTYLLTGTPFTKGYVDLYAQLKLLGCQMTKGQFVDEFCIRGEVKGLLGWQQPIIGYRNLNSLFNLVHRYAITIKSEDVIDLPEKIFTFHKTPMSKDFVAYSLDKTSLQRIYDTALRHNLSEFDVIVENDTLANRLVTSKKKKKWNNPFYRDIDYPNSRWLAETSGQCYLRARELSIGFNGNATQCVWYDKSRLEELEHFLEIHEENYVLFYNFTAELVEIYDICERLGYNIDVYCGDIKSLHFYEEFCSLSDADKLTTKKNLILANFASGSTGMNWQQYHHCIVFSLPVFRDWQQGIKRVHRTGQKFTVFYHVFMQNNWLDTRMYEALTSAQEYDEKMFESDIHRINSLMEETDNED